MAEKSSARVERIIRFIERLIVPSGKGEGKPFKLRKFQRAFITDVYGPVNNVGNRRIRRAILSMGRKNGKTMIVACLILVHLVGPESITNGEIYSAANSREQASKVFKYAAQIVRADPELLSLIKIVDSTKTMVHFGSGSVYRAVSADAGTNYGENPSFVVYDELAQARNNDLYEALDTSMGAREEPLFVVISTQSKDPQHILSQIIDDGLSGRDDAVAAHVYTVPEDTEDIFDEKCWKLANPALGDFLHITEMRNFAKKAKRMPGFENAFRNLYLNQRVDIQAPLIPRAEWMGCKGDETVEPGTEIYLGLDLSKKTDLTALVGVTAGEKDVVRAWFWKPGDTLNEHERRDRVPYGVWKKQGFLEAPPGKSIDYDWVARRLGVIASDYRIVGIAFDRKYIDDLLKAMSRAEVDSYRDDKSDKPIAHNDGAIRMVDWGQGFYDMPSAVDALETAVLNRTLSHDGNPVLTWNISNAMTISDAAGGRKIDKSKARFRIDGAVALAMALGLKSRDMKETGPAAYEGLTKEEIRSRMAF
jgi:phage terminase large subunit-like protein